MGIAWGRQILRTCRCINCPRSWRQSQVVKNLMVPYNRHSRNHVLDLIGERESRINNAE